MTIYVDQMFLENFIMNYIILYLTSKFSGNKSKCYRLAIGAIIGAVYVILSYIFVFYNKRLIVSRCILSVAILFSAFSIKNIKDFFKLLIFFLGITFFIGGASFGLAFFMNMTMINEGGILYVDEFPVLMIAIGTVVTIIIVKWICIFLKRKVNTDELLYKLDICFFEKKISTTVLLDTGHNVKERITGYPVIIIENNLLKNLIPEEIMKKIYENNFDFEEKYKRRLRLIPISTVSSKNEILIGFKVDRCIIHIESQDKMIENIIVVGCDRKLDNQDNYFSLMGDIL